MSETTQPETPHVGIFWMVQTPNGGLQPISGAPIAPRAAEARQRPALAGVEPRFEKLNGDIVTREWTKGQKAMALAIIHPEPKRG